MVWACGVNSVSYTHLDVYKRQNLLQCLKTDADYFVTLNPICEIDPKKTIKSISFEHPYFDAKALAAQKKLPNIQGIKNTYYCGSYFCLLYTSRCV